MTAENGRKGALREGVAAAAEAIDQARREADGEQLDLLPTRFEGARAEQQRKLVANQSGAGGGRPPGAQNIATRQFREYMLSRYGHPLEWLARWAMHTPESLAKELSCSTLDAFDRLRMMRTELAPYFAAKMQPVDDNGQAVPLFNLVIGGQNANLGAGGVAPWMTDPEVAKAIEAQAEPRPNESKGNQGLSEGAPEKSHGESRTNGASD